MGNGRKRLKFEIFFERYFGNFKKILLTNILFAIPSAVVFIALYFINQAIFSGINLVFSMIAIIPLYPFYAGVVLVVRNIVRGDEDVPVVKTFFSAIRHNFLTFLLHGVCICAATVVSYLSLRFYIHNLSLTWLMYVVLFFCILVVLLALYTSFYLPLMSLTYELKLRYQYKNSFLMSFGEFKNNFFATLALAIFFGICMTATAFLPSATVLIIVVSVLWAFWVPATATFCSVFFIYDGMAEVIANKEEMSRKINDEINAAKSKDKLVRPQLTIEEEDYSDLDINQLKDTDDFIFYHGRMVKQSALLKILREKEAQNEVTEDE